MVKRGAIFVPYVMQIAGYGICQERVISETVKR